MSLPQGNANFAWLDDVDFAQKERTTDDHLKQKPVSLLSPQDDGTLYCREKERDELLHIYEKMKASTDASKTHVLMYRGATGVGKTKLAMSLRSVVEQDGGYFIVGKFDRRPEPHAAIVSAFSEFARAAMARGDLEVERIREAVSNIDPADRTLLTGVFPALAKIFVPPTSDQQTENPDETASAMGSVGIAFNRSPDLASGPANRCKRALQMLVRAISSPEQPLVILLDNFHYADEGSLDLLRNAIIMDDDNRGVLVLLTYREEANSSSSRNIVDVLPTPSAGVMEGTLTRLKTLNEGEVNNVISKVLSVGPETTQSLATLIHNKSNGNFLTVFEHINALNDDGFLQLENGQLRWDSEAVQNVLLEGRNIVLQKVSELTKASQDLLSIAACLGSSRRISLLSHFATESALHDFYDEAEGKGLLFLDQKKELWDFAHDIISETIYEALTPQQREALHYRIGRKLWRDFDIETLDRRIFTVVGQLMDAGNVIKEQKERVAIAKLCLRAGEQAVHLSNFYTSYLYLMHGISLLGRESWRDEYDLCIKLHNAGAEIAFSSGHTDIVFQLVDRIVENARTFNDTIRGRIVKIYAFGSRFELQEAMGCAHEVLQLLGEPLPSQPSRLHGFFAMRKMKRMLRNKSSESILRMPNMSDPQKIDVMQVLNMSFRVAFISGGLKLATLMALRMTELTLEHGLSPMSSVSFAACAAGFCAVGSIDEGYRIGQLALALNEKFNAKPFFARTAAFFYECVDPWKRPFQLALQSLHDAYRAGIESGDVEFAFLCFNCRWVFQFPVIPLQYLADQMHDYSRRMEHFGLTGMDQWGIRCLWQAIDNLMDGSRGDPEKLDGEIFGTAQLEVVRMKGGILYALTAYPRCMLCYLFGDYEQAAMFAEEGREISKLHLSPIINSRMLLLDGLVDIVISRKRKRRRAIRAAKVSKILRRWSAKAPHNFLALYFLLSAELAALKRDHDSAFRKYVGAIAMAKESGFLFHTALSNELCGKYLLGRKEQDVAEGFFRDSICGYLEWNAVAKAEHLCKEVRVHGFESLEGLI